MEITHSFGDMAKWPVTPGMERLKTAMAFMKWLQTDHEWDPAAEKQQAAQDAWNLKALLEDAPEYRQTALEAMAKAATGDPQGDMPRDKPVDLALMAEVAAKGSTRGFIGAGFLMSNPVREYPQVNQLRLAFTRLNPDPDWTGLDTLWPLCQGGILHVFQDALKTPGGVEMILSLPASTLPETGNRAEIPQGMPGLLERIATWHGAADCIWHEAERTPGYTGRRGNMNEQQQNLEKPGKTTRESRTAPVNTTPGAGQPELVTTGPPGGET